MSPDAQEEKPVLAVDSMRIDELRPRKLHITNPYHGINESGILLRWVEMAYSISTPGGRSRIYVNEPAVLLDVGDEVKLIRLRFSDDLHDWSANCEIKWVTNEKT